MSGERRNYGRLSGGRLGDVLVKVECANCTWHGSLENICGEGLCMGLQAGVGPSPGRGTTLHGWLHGADMPEPVEFAGSVMWSAEQSKTEGRQTLIGVFFDQDQAPPRSLWEAMAI